MLLLACFFYSQNISSISNISYQKSFPSLIERKSKFPNTHTPPPYKILWSYAIIMNLEHMYFFDIALSHTGTICRPFASQWCRPQVGFQPRTSGMGNSKPGALSNCATTPALPPTVPLEQMQTLLQKKSFY